MAAVEVNRLRRQDPAILPIDLAFNEETIHFETIGFDRF